MKIPWQIPTGLAILAGSLVPSWLIDLSDAPTETSIRFWATLVVGVALLGIARGISFFRWLLAGLLMAGAFVSAESYMIARTVEVESLLITLAQFVGLALLFTPAANAWVKARRAMAAEPN